MNYLDHLPTIVTVCVLILLLALESWLPAVIDRRRRLRHAARNLTLGLLNAVALAVLVAPFIARVAAWAEESRFGLLRLLNMPAVITAAAAILLFDSWMYLWHRANHELGFLWRFHRVHHSDPEMDATSATRFHTGEILISSALRLAVIPLLGITIHQLLVYEMLLLPVILFHHSNIRFPERLDAHLRLVIVTPAVHRVHHSRLRIETDSNYSSVFSFWDRIAGTFRLRRDGQPVNFGLDEYDGERWQRLSGLMVMPFPPARRGSAVGVKNIIMIMKISILTFIYIGLLVPALPAAEHPAMQANIYSPAKIEWKAGPPSLPPGAQIAVLEGDPTKEGMFVMRIRVPNGYHIPAHTHPKPERVTIIQGTFKLAMGENPKVADAQILPVRTFGIWPAGMVHAVWIEGETIVQFHGMGP